MQDALEDSGQTLTLDDLRGTPRVAQVLERVFFQAMAGDLKAAEIYLKRVMPEVKSVEVSLKKPIEEMEDAELLAAIKHLTNLIAAQGVDGGVGAQAVTQTAH